MKLASLFIVLLSVLLSIIGCGGGGADSEGAIDADPGEPRIREERPVPSPRLAAGTEEDEGEPAPDEIQDDSADETTDDGAVDAETLGETAEITEESTPEPPDDASDKEPATEPEDEGDG